MKIVIIDRYPILRRGLSLFLTRHFSDLETIECSCKEELKLHSASTDIALIIIALNQSLDLNDIDEINGAKKWCPTAKMVGYLESPDPSTIEPYVTAGLSGYFSKQDNLEDFASYLSKILTGKKVTNAALYETVERVT